jgi:hypothetical protein
MEFDNKTILIIAAVLFILFMLSRGGTSSYEENKFAKFLPTGMMRIKKKEKEKYCPMCN